MRRPSLLESEGMESIWVTELEDGEVSEDDAVCALPVKWDAAASKSVWRRWPGHSARHRKLLRCWWDDELLKQINCTSSVALATAIGISAMRWPPAHRYGEKRAVASRKSSWKRSRDDT